MNMKDQIKMDMKASMKSRDAVLTSTLRLIMSEIQREPNKDVSDERVVSIIRKMAKDEKDNLARDGKVASDYLDILEKYLPVMATELEIEKWIGNNISFSKFKNKMQAVGVVMKHFGSRADGNMVKKVIMRMNT